ncbi:MAG: AbrB/MazE/SpoVT family DNA-binding domain-containing protein [Chloroflexi bacterium]|nr:AbrB/MazE/SpoVT family DNA-binding domain-containing protein [Chloroflexota bacterium]
MGRNSHISKWGTSLAIRIPKAIAQQWGVREGSAIEIISRGDHVVLRKETYNLADMLDQVTDDNLHSEQDTGPIQGNEEW